MTSYKKEKVWRDGAKEEEEERERVELL